MFIISLILVILSSTYVQSESLSENKDSYAYKLKSVGPAWTINSLNAKGLAITLEKNKDPIIVAVIDTGIDYYHSNLNQSSILSSTLGKSTYSDYGVDFSSGSKKTKPKDSHGHGTHVSGVILKMDPEVKLLILKYYNPNAKGDANLKASNKALKFAIDSNVDIINYSGGGGERSSEEFVLLLEAKRKGILIVAAAGNESNDLSKVPYYPASYGLSNIISVASLDRLNILAKSSNYGAKSVDVAAPGVRIKSLLPHSRLGYLTGTSQATSFVSGMVSFLKELYPGKTNKSLIKSLITTSKILNSTRSKIKSKGIINLKKSILNIKDLMSKKMI